MVTDLVASVLFHQHWSKLEEKIPEYFVTFPTDTRIYQRPVTTHGTKQIKVQLPVFVFLLSFL